MVRPGEYLSSPADLPYIDRNVELGGRAVIILPYYSSEAEEWFGFVQYPDGRIQRVGLVDVVSGSFLASAPLKDDEDLALPLEDMVFQKMSFSGVARPLSGFEDVVESFAALLELYERVSLDCAERRPGATQTAQLLVNHLLVVARSGFDVLQEIIRAACSVTRRIDDTAKHLMNPLADSFAQVALNGDTPRTPEELVDKFRMPPALARFYSSHGPFLANVRAIRDEIVHRGHHAGFILHLDEGLAVITEAAPWNKLAIWDEESLVRGRLGSLRKLFAYTIAETLSASTHFSEAFASCIALPEALSPGNRVFLRGPLNHHLVGLREVLETPWERREKLSVRMNVGDG
jgi:hypothetical protein